MNKIMNITHKNKIKIMNDKEIINLFETPENLYFKQTCGDIQRLLNQEHCNALIQYQLQYYETYQEYSFPNPIIVCILNGKYAILDGQHRYETIKYLSRAYPDRSMNIILSCINIDSEHEYIELFKAVNKNMPLPPMIQNNTDMWMQIGKKIHTYFIQNYKCYHKASDNPRIPHINFDKMMEYIQTNKIIEKCELQDHQQFIDAFEKLNGFYRLHWKTAIQKYMKDTSKRIQDCEAKQPDKPLFVGIYKKFEWLDRIVLKIKDKMDYETMEHIESNHRIKIKKPLRKQVWRTYIGILAGIWGDEGNCFVCQTPIDYDEFQCGHVISVFHGGQTNIDNLRPICGMCNRDMGIRNLDDYKEEYISSINEDMNELD